MMNSPQQPLAADEISLKNWINSFGNMRRHLFARWKIIGFAMLTGGIIGLAYTSFRKPTYKAVCTFVLEDNGKSGNSGLGQYSALASIVGIDVNGGSGLFQGDNIIELYKSRSMIERTLLSPAIFKGRQQLLIDRYIQMNKLDLAWADSPKMKGISFAIPKKDFKVEQDSIISAIVENLNKNYLTVSKPDKKLTIVSVQVKAPDPLFAKAFTETIVNNVNTFYIQTKTKGMVQNLVLLQKQADSVRRALNASISGTAAALDIYPNANPIMQSLRVPSQKRQVDVQAASAIYSEVVKNLEIAKGSLMRETPLIQVIDEPVLPLPNDRIGRLKGILTGMGIALLVATISILIMRSYHKIME
ncbi:lipopolysaccharide biosynthesis protein [Pedobacter chinensis]|uniref:Lipopolysaccharide biosynthesis protein n=1 Tax=Pedobacter chinensis TaxID=2282421 RepID=A0A369PTG8_9SPHI|nr:Wzz/FepE/Etk N-terminal domain-containing protein [Pedobacter chinensis]RDC55824.1 lipopolysaccharide biosynthesis protein [Pedobacter chinensis]